MLEVVDREGPLACCLESRRLDKDGVKVVGMGDDGEDDEAEEEEEDALVCFLCCLGEAGGLCLVEVGDGGAMAACSAAAVTLTPFCPELPLLLLPEEDGGDPLLFLRGDFDLAMEMIDESVSRFVLLGPGG